MNEQSNDGTVTEADRIIAADIFEKMNSEWSCNDVAIQIRAHVAVEVKRETEALLEKQATRDRFNIKCHQDQVDALRAENDRLKAEVSDSSNLAIFRGKETSAVLEQLATAKAAYDELHLASQAEVERLKAALEPILIAGNGSSEGFAELFEEAAEKPLYWTELAKLAQYELATAKLGLALETSRAEAALRIAETANKGFDMCDKELREAKADVKELVGALQHITESVADPATAVMNSRVPLAPLKALIAKHADGRAR